MTDNYQYADKVLDDRSLVRGEIYKVVNTVNGKAYIGQTMTHHMNKGKYRPFGYTMRFNNHVKESQYVTSQNNLFKSAIRKYGAACFTTELVCRCEIHELDENEIFYIQYFNTLHPNGYNMTAGGKTARYVKADGENDCKGLITHKGRRDYQTEHTKQKIRIALLQKHQDASIKEKWSKNAEKQHMVNKLSKFEDHVEFIDQTNLDKHVKTKLQNGHKRYIVNVNGMTTSFYSTIDPDEITKKRAYEFLTLLVSRFGNTTKLREHPESSLVPPSLENL